MRGVGGRALIALVLVAVLGSAACSKGSDSGGVAAGTTQPGTTAPLSGGDRPKCTAQALTPALSAKFPGAGVMDVTCASTGGAAVVTVTNAPGVAGDGVVFLQTKGTDWVIVASGPVGDDDGKSLLPKDFSVTLYQAWVSAYDARMHPERATVTTTTVLGGAGVTSPGHPGEICKQVDDRVECETTTTTTLPPTTTTESTTTTTPITLPPGPVPPSTQPVGPSPFCLAHPLDPRCKDPSFPG